MAISNETMWTVVVCGLIAHADEVLDGEECELLLTLVEDEADGDEYAEWLGTVGDRQKLEHLFDQLPTPEPERHRELLERAWMMAMIDGARTEPEIRVLKEIAGRIGVEPMQLDYWLEAWTAGEQEFSEATASALSTVLGGSGPVFSQDRAMVDEVVARLPTTDEQRESLLERALSPGNAEDATRRLNALKRAKRLQVLRLLVSPMVRCQDSQGARDRFLALAEAVDIESDRVQRLLAEHAS